MATHSKGSKSSDGGFLASGPSATSPAPRVPPGRSHLAVLVVDDDEWLRGLVVAVLRASGYLVHETATANDALDVLRSPAGSDIVLMLSDVVLPGMNGYALADILRRDRPGLRVLLMTGRLPALLPEGDAGMGFGRILQKPFTPGDLLEAVAERLSDVPA